MRRTRYYINNNISVCAATDSETVVGIKNAVDRRRGPVADPSEARPDNMRLAPQRILRVLAVTSVVYGVKAATEDHLQSTSMTGTPAVFADALGCLADQLSSSDGGNPGPGTCYDMVLSLWNHVQEPHGDTIKGTYILR